MARRDGLCLGPGTLTSVRHAGDSERGSPVNVPSRGPAASYDRRVRDGAATAGEETDAEANAGRRRTAVLSVVAACVLVVLKLVTGLITGSLGLLAEAAHSGADLVAALLTLFAVSVAVKPADHEHQFGHGKAEHLAALAEAAFLLLVSAWLGSQAIGRLLDPGGHTIDAAWWAILVLVVVIAIDLTRMLASTARRSATDRRRWPPTRSTSPVTWPVRWRFSAAWSALRSAGRRPTRSRRCWSRCW